MPKDMSRHLCKYKLMFKSRMKKSVEADMMRFQVRSEILVSQLLLQT